MALMPLRKGRIGVTDLRGKPLMESCSLAVCMARNDPSGSFRGSCLCLLVRTKNLQRTCLLTDRDWAYLLGLVLLIAKLVISEATEG